MASSSADIKSFRELLTLIESFQSDLGDERYWITPTGEIEEVDNEDTHAEHVYYHHFTGDETEDEYLPDNAFYDAIEAGWIRIGLTPNYTELFITLNLNKVKRPAWSL